MAWGRGGIRRRGVVVKMLPGELVEVVENDNGRRWRLPIADLLRR